MIYGPGSPLKLNTENLWHDNDKTNGRVMRSVDGRVPTIQQGFSRIDIGLTNVISAAGAVPFGNALWRDISTIDVDPGVVKTEKPAAGLFLGILPFNQGFATGNPLLNWGVPAYSRSDMVNKGFIEYKVWMAAVGQEANYFAYLQGDTTQDINTVRLVYDDVIALYKAAADGSKLGMFFGNASGFPLISVVAPADQAAPTMTGATFGGFIEIMEPEQKSMIMTLAF